MYYTILIAQSQAHFHFFSSFSYGSVMRKRAGSVSSSRPLNDIGRFVSRASPVRDALRCCPRFEGETPSTPGLLRHICDLLWTHDPLVDAEVMNPHTSIQGNLKTILMSVLAHSDPTEPLIATSVNTASHISAMLWLHSARPI